MAYAADDSATALALGDHVPRTCADASARQLARGREVGVGFHDARAQTRAWPVILKLAVQRVLDELVAVFEQVCAELATGAAQAVQRVEVELAGELAGNAVSVLWSATMPGHSLSPPQKGSSSRITAEGGCKSIVHVGVRPVALALVDARTQRHVGDPMHKTSYVGRVVDVLQVSEHHHDGRIRRAEEAFNRLAASSRERREAETRA